METNDLWRPLVIIGGRLKKSSSGPEENSRTKNDRAHMRTGEAQAIGGDCEPENSAPAAASTDLRKSKMPSVLAY